jgi:hypothetical protein
MFLAEEDGEVTKATADEVIVKYKSGQAANTSQRTLRVQTKAALLTK